MLVYRITRTIYAGNLSGDGAKRYGGRWNHKGTALVYSSAYISLAFLELLVNADPTELENDFKIIVIHIPDLLEIKFLDPALLKEGWRMNSGDESRSLGTRWCLENQGAILAVPSAVIPFEYNYLLNPNHPDFTGISIDKVLDLEIDSRFKDLKEGL
jgi:RES domain-containing protein